MSTDTYENRKFHQINVPLYRVPHTPLHYWYPGRLTSPDDYYDLRELKPDNQELAEKAFYQRKMEIKEAFRAMEERSRELGRGPEGFMDKTPLFAFAEPEAMIEEPSLKQVDINNLPFNEQELRGEQPGVLPQFKQAERLREVASDELYKGDTPLRGLGGTYDNIEGFQFMGDEKHEAPKEECGMQEYKPYIIAGIVAAIIALLLCLIFRQ